MRDSQRVIALAKANPDRKIPIQNLNPKKAKLALKAIEKKYGKKGYDELKGIAREHRQFEHDAILKPLLRIGKLSQETYDKITSAPEFEYYSSFLRVMEGVEESTGGKDPIKTIYGSLKQKIPSTEGTVQNLTRTIKLVETLRLNKLVSELSTQEGTSEFIKQKRGRTQPINTFEVYNDGKVRYFSAPKDVLEAMDQYAPKEMNWIIKLLNYPTKLLRAGAILSTEFIVRNPVRDQFTAWINSNFGYNPFTGFARGVYNTILDTKLHSLFKQAGGEQAYFTSLDREAVNVTVQNIVGFKRQGFKEHIYAANPIRALQAMSNWMEKGTRMGLFANAIKKGATPQEAMAEAKEGTLDFGRIGTYKALNQISAFWNANVQGTDKLVRNFKNHPKRTLFKAIAGITIPTILLWLINKDDERYKNLPEWQKNFFWIIILGDEGAIIRIPKPFEIGIIFGSLPERILDFVYHKDKGAIKSVMKAMKEGVMPNLLPTAMLPAIEHLTNYSVFRERQLEPASTRRLPAGLRITGYTGATAKRVGELTNISPIMLENWVSGWSGGLGKSTLKLLDLAIGTGEPTAVGQKWYEATPFVKGFIAREPIGSASKPVEDFYRNANEAIGFGAAMKQLKGTKRIAFGQKHRKALRFTKRANATIRRMGRIRRSISIIRESRSISSADKRFRINNLNKRITSLARQFNAFYN